MPKFFLYYDLVPPNLSECRPWREEVLTANSSCDAEEKVVNEVAKFPGWSVNFQEVRMLCPKCDCEYQKYKTQRKSRAGKTLEIHASDYNDYYS